MNIKKTYDKQELPQDLELAIKERLKKAQMKTNRNNIIKLSSRVLMAAAAIFILTINLSSQIALASEKIPVLGSIVKLVNVKTYTLDEKDKEIAVKIPHINSKEDSINSLNKKYLKEGQNNYRKFIEVKGKSYANMNYKKIVDDSRFLVIKRQVTVSQADSYSENKFDTIDKMSGVVVTLPMLFKDTSYINEINHEITKQIKHSNKNFWTKEDEKGGTVKQFTTINRNQKFYINKDHHLVIVFDPMQIAPNYVGSPEFIIPTKVINTNLVNSNYLK